MQCSRTGNVRRWDMSFCHRWGRWLSTVPFTWLTALTWLAVCSPAVHAQPSPGREPSGGQRPNIVVIMADDMGYGDASCYPDSWLSTPHLDRLADEGMRFTDFHSSGPVCSPTRAGLLTGRYQQRAGIPGVVNADPQKNRHHGLFPKEITFAELLKDAGYTTAVFGKWHVGYRKKFNPVHHGFDRFRGYVSGNVDYISHVDRMGFADWWDGKQLAPEEGYTTHLITEHSVKFVEENKDRPFCLYIAHEAVHSPYQGPNDEPVRAVGKGNLPGTGREDRKAAYREMMAEMDKGVGEVVETLKRLGLAERTFVFFFSDNGANRRGSNGALRGYKGSVWEGGHRVPAIAWWPGHIEPGTVCDETAISLDLMPTMLELAGVEVPSGHKLDGTSLVPALTPHPSPRRSRPPDGTSNEQRRPNRLQGPVGPSGPTGRGAGGGEGELFGERTLFWEFRGKAAVRNGPWKLVLNEGGLEGDVGLFNLAKDLSEEHNLSQKHPERVRTMRRALRQWKRDVTTGATQQPHDK